MKQLPHIILVLTFLLGFSSVHSQIFGLRQRSPKNYYSNALKSAADGKFRVENNRPANAPGIRNGLQILQYGANFQLEDSIDFPRGIYSGYIPPKRFADKYYWPGGYVDTIGFQIRYPGVIELDTNYAYKNFYRIGPSRTNNYYATNLVAIANRFYFGTMEFFPAGGMKCTFYKLTKQFTMLDSASFNASLVDMFDLNGQLAIIGCGFPSPCLPQTAGRLQKLTMDTSMTLSKCFTLDSLGIESHAGTNYKLYMDYAQGQIIPISNTKLLALGNSRVWYNGGSQPYSYVMVNGLLNKNDSVQKAVVFGNPLRTQIYMDWFRCYDVKGDKILTVGCVDCEKSVPFTNQFQKTKIFVTKIDTNGNYLWSKEHGGDMFYKPNSIAFTNDGGCLVAGWRYDSAHTAINGIFESFLLKLDANGDCLDVSIFENGKQLAQPLRCFPNPAKEQLYFDVPFQEAILIEVYDQLGRMVLREKDYANLSPLDLHGLSPNLYHYQIKTKMNCYSGSFLKD